MNYSYFYFTLYYIFYYGCAIIFYFILDVYFIDVVLYADTSSAVDKPSMLHVPKQSHKSQHIPKQAYKSQSDSLSSLESYNGIFCTMPPGKLIH